MDTHTYAYLTDLSDAEWHVVQPLQIAASIGQEYAVVHALDFSLAPPNNFTTNAIHATFTPPARKATLLAELAEVGFAAP